MTDVLVILCCGIAVAAFCVWMRAWAAALADVLWALALRPRLVGAVVLSTCLVLLAGSLTLPLSGLVATRFLALLAIAPFVIRPASHHLAAWRDGTPKPSKSYIFDHRRDTQKAKFLEEDEVV